MLLRGVLFRFYALFLKECTLLQIKPLCWLLILNFSVNLLKLVQKLLMIHSLLSAIVGNLMVASGIRSCTEVLTGDNRHLPDLFKGDFLLLL